MSPKTALVSAMRPVVADALRDLERLGGIHARGAPDPAVFLHAVALQESGYIARAQIGGGPAHGFWQFEQGGGVSGVLYHPQTGAIAKRLCALYHVTPLQADIWRAIEGHDLLAAGFARLLLWTDPKQVPGSEADAWACYQRLWRPGRPRPTDWHDNWTAANGALT